MSQISYILFGVTLFCIFLTGSSLSYDTSVELMEDMLDGYNKKHRPVSNQFLPILVNVSFEMIFLQDLDELSGKFTAFGLFTLSWMDEKIVWDPSKYGGLWTQLYATSDVWYPPLVATTSFDKIEDIADDWMTVRLYFSGLAQFTPGKVIKSVCSIDVTYYPFDIQECTITYNPWGLWPNEITLNSVSPYAAATYYTEGGEWEIIANSTYVDAVNNLYLHFKLKRKPLFAVINIILPIILMSLLNVLVFVLPAESGERVSYAITVLLATAVFLTLVADNLPKTSQPMSVLAYFLMVNLTISTLMCVATILNLRVYFKKENQPVPYLLKAIVRLVNCAMCRRKRTAPNQVVPIDINVIIKPESKEALKDETHLMDTEDKDEPITWHDVASTIDKILLVFFLGALVTVTTVFIVFLSQNKGAIDTEED